MRWPFALRSTVAHLERRIATLMEIGNHNWSVNLKLRQELERMTGERKRLRAEIHKLQGKMSERKADIRRLTERLALIDADETAATSAK